MRPTAPHAFAMTWTDGLFAHWPFDPDVVRPHVPAPLELDTREGRAWVSVLPFVLSDAGFRFSPPVTRLTFPELNFRTYVRLEGQPGLYFFSIDVDSATVASLVQTATRLPCYFADIDVRAEDDLVEFHSVRNREEGRPARFVASYRPDGKVFHAEPGSLDYWLAERRRMYAPEAAGRAVLYGDISHGPWPLQPAEATIQGNTLFETIGLPTPDADPRLRYSGERSMTGSVLRRIRPR